MLRLKPSGWMIVLAAVACIFVYAHGLNGPFLFDDHVHITKNQWVKITSLDWHSLTQAWNSSFSSFPSDRPLSQLTFGVNHAISGLNPLAFKITNLAIHLLNGGLVYVFVRLACCAATGRTAEPQQAQLLALVTAAFWLLHPMHVSTVLYSVQRMALLSTLSLLAALTVYFHGRLQISRGQHGAAWMIVAAPIAMIGFLAKENTVLLPLLLLVSELTVLKQVGAGSRKAFLRSIWVLFILSPLLIGTWYLLSHQATLLVYDGRPFGLEERALTQPRVLWLYLQWLFVPDISAFGLFHDDIPASTGLLSPLSTVTAIIGLCVLLGAAFLGRKSMPVPAFAVLFFFANHALESTVLPLEMVFEHRNYLASVGPLLLLAYLIVITSARYKVGSLARTVAILLLLSHSVVTYLRVDNWSSYNNFILTTAKHHPNSSRANFAAAQLMISAFANSEPRSPALADSARYFLQNGLAADPRCIDCLFGLVVLDLELGRRPDADLITHLTDALREGFVGPTKVSLSQFSYLVKWQRSGASTLDPADIESIFDAALANRSWGRTGRAGIQAAYREYYEFVVRDLAAALIHAKAAVASWPEQWNYHMQLVHVLEKLGRGNEVLVALDTAAAKAKNEKQKRETAEARARILHKLPD